MIIHNKRRVRPSSQNLIHFTIRCNLEKNLSTSIKYYRFQKKIKKQYVAPHFITHYQVKNDALLWKLLLLWLHPIANESRLNITYF